MKDRFHQPMMLAAMAGASIATCSAHADINLELRPTPQLVIAGNAFTVDIYAVSDHPLINQSTSAMQVILTWDTAFVQLTGLDNSTSPMFISSFIPGDPFGLNASTTDGDALWNGFATPGVPIQATPAGTYLTTFNFVALNQTSPTTLIDIPATGGNGGTTAVYDGTVPNLDVTGTLSGATIQVVPGPGALCMFAVALGCMGCGRRRRA